MSRGYGHGPVSSFHANKHKRADPREKVGEIPVPVARVPRGRAYLESGQRPLTKSSPETHRRG